MARLTLRLANTNVRESLASVLTPDNEGAPRGLDLSMTDKGTEIEFLVSSDSATAVLSTVLALLRDVTLFQEVWLLSRGEGGRAQRG